MQHRLYRRAPRIGDRPLGQAGHGISVVGVHIRNLGLTDAAAERLALGDGVDDRGIGLQHHVLPQPVGVDGGHRGALCRQGGFLLHDRCQRQRLLGRLDHDVRIALGPKLGHRLGHRFLHALQHRRTRLAALKAVAFGQNGAFGRHRNVTGQKRFGHQPIAHHDRRHALRYGDEPVQHIAALQYVHHRAVAGFGGNEKLARLDRRAAAQQARPVEKGLGGLDRARLFQRLRRPGERGAFLDDDREILRRRAVGGPAIDEIAAHEERDTDGENEDEETDFAHEEFCSGNAQGRKASWQAGVAPTPRWQPPGRGGFPVRSAF